MNDRFFFASSYGRVKQDHDSHASTFCRRRDSHGAWLNLVVSLGFNQNLVEMAYQVRKRSLNSTARLSWA
jgi:hypothetical protein